MTCPEKKSSDDWKRGNWPNSVLIPQDGKEGRRENKGIVFCTNGGNLPSVPRQLHGDGMTGRLDIRPQLYQLQQGSPLAKPMVRGKAPCSSPNAPG